MDMGEEAGSAQSPRRGWPRIGVAAVVIAVVIAALVVVIALNRMVLSARPIEQGTTTMSEGEHRTMDPPGANSALIYRYREGAEFSYGLNVVNSGPLAVRVADLPMRAAVHYYAERVFVEMGDASVNEIHGGSPDRWIPFAPFDLTPGNYRSLRITYRFRACKTAPIPATSPREVFHGGTWWDTLPVRVEILGIEREYDLELRDTIALEGTDGLCWGVPS